MSNNNDMKRLSFLFAIACFILSACTPARPSLPVEMIASMTAYSEEAMEVVQL